MLRKWIISVLEFAGKQAFLTSIFAALAISACGLTGCIGVPYSETPECKAFVARRTAQYNAASPAERAAMIQESNRIIEQANQLSIAQIQANALQNQQVTVRVYGY
jgi:hypothetical protein